MKVFPNTDYSFIMFFYSIGLK